MNPLVQRRPAVTSPDPTAVTPIRVASLLAGDERMPVYVHLLDHRDGRVLVDTGITRLHPAVADMDPQLSPLTDQDIDLGSITAVVNTHLHFDHCGGNHLFAGLPVLVQRRELEDARTRDDYTIRELRRGRWRVRAALRCTAAACSRSHAWITDRRCRDGSSSDRDRRRHGGVVR
jgi:glyoxylase-like metal-dependent hydrolase (beta-lactamase superfamily II)